MEIKLVALDMDGTTLQGDFKTISDRTRKALEAVIEQGIHVIPATGRILGQIPESVSGIEGVRYAVTADGAMVSDLCTGEMISANYLEADDVRAIIEFLVKRQQFCEVFFQGHSYGEKRHFEQVDKRMMPKELVEFLESKVVFVEDIQQFVMEHVSKIEKINISLLGDEEKRFLWKKFSGWERVTLYESIPHYIEITHYRSSKGAGLAHLCQMLNVKPESVMAVGDGDNDLSMIEFAGLGVAMGNADAEIKSCADYVTLPFYEEGVAHAIEKFVLKEGVPEN